MYSSLNKCLFICSRYIGKFKQLLHGLRTLPYIESLMGRCRGVESLDLGIFPTICEVLHYGSVN